MRPTKITIEKNNSLYEAMLDKTTQSLEKIISNSGEKTERQLQMFFNWWDGLRVLKYVHYCRDLGDQMLPPKEALTMLNIHHWKEEIPSDETGLLRWIRLKDRA